MQLGTRSRAPLASLRTASVSRILCSGPAHFGVKNNGGRSLKKFRKAVVQPLVVGFLLLVPVYLVVLLLLKAMKSLGKLVQPFVRLLPESAPAETVISLLCVAMQGHYALGIRFEGTCRSYA